VKIPEGMTEQELTDQIMTVVNRIAPKYTFYGYTTDDIKQEAFIICMDALNRYDGERRLENFLSVNLSNRLKNFVRDNHFTNNDPPGRVNVLRPAQLDNEDSLEEIYIDDKGYNLDTKNMIGIINRDLPPSMRMDYLKMINDVYVPVSRKQDIKDTVKAILEDNGFYEER
jgi:DNA-directed RNA polymerase specialized sigma24 family protein